MGKRKVVSIKKRFRPQSSLAFFLLLLIVVYIVVLAWGYFAKEHISIYEVNTTDISDDAPLYGFVMRAEEIVNSEDILIIIFRKEAGLEREMWHTPKIPVVK